ncbi:MAG: hypothetical protein D6732_08500 [Methanobacteriota archaeon]|nr:MAG: hypothetical protein D6732_08500 [Euryarchaeota archaeon]
MSAINAIVEFVRETPEQSVPEKQEHQDRLTDLIFCLLIFSISYWLKFFIIGYYLDVVGNNTSFSFINTHEELYWLTSLFGWKPGESIVVEGYVDFSWYYLPYVDNFSQGWNPYEGEQTAIFHPERMGGYVYGPLYIVWISLGKIFFGLDARQSVLVSNVIFDSLTSVLVYVLAKRVTGNGIALILGFLHTITPISLFYANIYGLNTPQMTFFAVLYLWFYLEHHDSWGFVILSLGFLTKQFPLLFAMPALMLMVRRYGWLRGFAFLVEFIIWSLIFSMPYIVLTPYLYIVKLFLASRAPSSVPTLEFLQENGGVAPNLVSSAVAQEDYGLANFLHILVDTQILFVGGLFLISYFAFSAYRILEERPYLFFRFAALYYFFAHGTIGRGIYKYYTPFLMPFLILALAPYRKKTFHIRLGKLLHEAWKKIFDPRFKMDAPAVNYWGLKILLLSVFPMSWIFVDWIVSLFVPLENRLWFQIIFFLAFVIAIIFPNPTSKHKETPVVINETAPSPLEKINKLLNLSPSQRKRIPIVVSFLLTLIVFSQFYNTFFDDNPFIALINSPAMLILAFALYLQSLQWDQKTESAKIENIGPMRLGMIVIFFFSFLFYFLNFKTPYFEETLSLPLGSLDISVNLLFSIILAYFLAEFLASTSLLYYIRNKNPEREDVPKLTFDLNLLGTSFLFSIGFYLVTLVSPLFFGSYTQKEAQFLLAAITFILVFMVIRNLILPNSDSFLIYHPINWSIDLLQLVILILVLFIVNSLILSVPRLMNPALIFLFSLALMPFMGEEYWFSLVDFHKRVIKNFQEIIGEKRK